LRNKNGEPQYYIIQTQDISNRKYIEQQLLYIANHDPLTGLYNRLQFHNCLTQTLSSVRRLDTKFAVMFLDLDRFKLINDTLGHQIGDQLLQAVSIRLKGSVRSNDTLARLGGDEFVMLVSDIHLIDDIARIAQKTIDLLMQPFTIEGNDIVITTSIGISVYPNDGDNNHSLLMNADTAMYLAKERGKNNYQFYTLAMTERSLERMTIERGLRHALNNHELTLHYQPKIDASRGRSVSVEALIRWQHPEWGLIFPDRFISVAEETGLIVPMGLWVLRTACLQAKAWQDHDGDFTQVAVNVSARQFLDPDLFKSIESLLAETGLKPSSLELEITESAVMQDPEWTLQVLERLHQLGVQLSIDDFGTGYSSLTYLRRFPVHNVKIDRSFVQNIPEDEGSMTLVRAIIALAHELKLSVTAEGVETEAQLAFLQNQQCDRLQGYLFSKPATVEQLETDFNSNTFQNAYAQENLE
jgi:diguanylate cyclase (GGDEF)-like protein